MAGTSLQKSLRIIGRRVRTVCVTAGMGWALVIGLALLFAWAALDLTFNLSPAVRAIGLITTVTCTAMLALSGIRRAIVLSDPAIVARRLDEVVGSRGRICSSVDLMLGHGPVHAGAHSTADPVGAALVNIAMDQAGQLAASVSPGQVISARSLLRPYAGVLGLCAFALVASLTAPEVLRLQYERFAQPFTHAWFGDNLRLNVQPGDATVSYGSSFDVQVLPEGGRARRVKLVLKPEGSHHSQSFPMTRDTSGTWRAILPNVTDGGTYFVQADEIVSQHFHLKVETTPELQAVRFRVTPPSYSRQLPYEGPLPPGGLAALRGTIVQVWAQSNRPLAGGMLRLLTGSAPATRPSDAAICAMTPTAPDSNEVAGAFRIDAPGKVQLRVTDIAGTWSKQTLEAPVAVVPDEPPRVRITDPKAGSFATPDSTLRVEIVATDDCGISKLSLLCTFNDAAERTARIPVPSPSPLRQPATVMIPLKDYALAPGDIVKLYAHVEDNDPAGPKGADSGVVLIRIVSQEEMGRLMTASAM